MKRLILILTMAATMAAANAQLCADCQPPATLVIDTNTYTGDYTIEAETLYVEGKGRCGYMYVQKGGYLSPFVYIGMRCRVFGRVVFFMWEG